MLPPDVWHLYGTPFFFAPFFHLDADPSYKLKREKDLELKIRTWYMYRDRLKCLYVVARSLLLLLLTCSAWLCLGPALADLCTYGSGTNS